MLSTSKTTRPPSPRTGTTSPALTLAITTGFVAFLAMVVSFSPAYAALNCAPNGTTMCFTNVGNPCGTGCIPDNNGDMCTDLPTNTITFFEYTGSRIWSKCTGGTLASQSCGETPTSCGQPIYYYKTFSTGSGGTANCTLTCMNPLIWMACSAANGASPCSGTGNPVPGQ